MQGDGNLVLYAIFLPTESVSDAYWDSKTVLDNSDTQLVFSEAGFIYLEREGKNIFNVTTSSLGPMQEYYYFARIDSDGAFRHYSCSRRNYAVDTARGSSAWSVVQTTPEDMCTAVMKCIGSGACGYNSYCVNSNGRPSCSCPYGYSPLDPLDLHRGCRPNFELPTCQQNGWETKVESVEFKELNNTDWPFTDYELQTVKYNKNYSRIISNLPNKRSSKKNLEICRIAAKIEEEEEARKILKNELHSPTL